MFLKNKYSTLDHSLFSWVLTYHFTKIFVHMSVIAAGWDPANIYLFKVNSRTLEKGVNYLKS